MRNRLIIVCLLLPVVIGAALLCWRYARSRQHERAVIQQAQRYFDHERRRDRPKAARIDPQVDDQESERKEFDKSKLRGVTIRRPGNAFQREDFTSAVLDDATLEAGPASFQLACFDRASLRKARLVGGASSFQEASFVGADLSAAHLSGNFQFASFEKAVLVRAKWSGSFQACNISGARFAGADLSEIQKDSLESCYFAESPTYRPDTRFPIGFDPHSQGWLLAVE